MGVYSSGTNATRTNNKWAGYGLPTNPGYVRFLRTHIYVEGGGTATTIQRWGWQRMTGATVTTTTAEKASTRSPAFPGTAGNAESVAGTPSGNPYYFYGTGQEQFLTMRHMAYPRPHANPCLYDAEQGAIVASANTGTSNVYDNGTVFSDDVPHVPVDHLPRRRSRKAGWYHTYRHGTERNNVGLMIVSHARAPLVWRVANPTLNVRHRARRQLNNVTQLLSANLTQATTLVPTNQTQKIVALTQTETLTVTKVVNKAIAVTQATALAATKLAKKFFGLGTVTGTAAFDAATNGNGATTFSHTVGSGTNRYLVVGLGWANTTAFASNVQYASTPMTQLVRSVGANFGTEIWGLANPTSGANNVTWTQNGAGGSAGGAMSFTGIAQAGALQATDSSGGTGTNIFGSNPITAAPGGMLAAMTVSSGAISLYSPSATQGWNDGSGDAMAYSPSTGSPQTIYWDDVVGQPNWEQSVVALNPPSSMSFTAAFVKLKVLAVSLTQATSLAVTKTPSKIIALTETASLALTRALTKTAFTVTQATSLAVIKQPQKLIALTQATSITATFVRARVLAVSLTQATSLAVTKKVSKSVALTQATALSVTKTVQKSIALTQATSLALTKAITKTAFALTQATSLTVIKSVTKSAFALTQATALAVTKQARKSIAVTQATSISATFIATKRLAVSLTQATSLATTRTVSKTIALTQATALTTIKQAQKIIALTQSLAFSAVPVFISGGGNLHTLSVNLTQATSIAVVNSTNKVIALTEAAVLTSTKAVTRTIAFTQTITLTVVKTAIKPVIALTQASSIAVTKQAQKVISLAPATTVTLRNFISRTFALTETAVLTMTKAISGRVFTFTQPTTLTVTKQPGKTITLAQASALVPNKTIVKVVPLTAASSVATVKQVQRIIALTETPHFAASAVKGGGGGGGGGTIPAILISDRGELFIYNNGLLIRI